VRQNNAYLLFYERVEGGANTSTTGLDGQQPQQLPAPTVSPRTPAVFALDSSDDAIPTEQRSSEVESLALRGSQTSAEVPQAPSSKSSSTPVSFVSTAAASSSGQDTTAMSSRVMDAVWTENMEFQTDRYLFDAMHFKFLWQILHAESLESILVSSPGTSPGRTDFSSNGIGETPPIEMSSDMVGLGEQGTGSTGPHSLLAVMVLRFVVEVVCRARAQSCVQLFFGRLEKIVNSDRSFGCAGAIISELAQDNTEALAAAAAAAAAAAIAVSQSQPQTPTRQQSNSAAVPPTPPATMSASKRAQLEKQFVQRACHTWLLQMFLMCPHPGSVRIFAKFLYGCFKIIRNECYTQYLVRDPLYSATTPTASSSGGNQSATNVLADTAAVGTNERTVVEQDAGSPDNANNAEDPSDPSFGYILPITAEASVISDSRVFACTATRFVHKLLLLAVNFQVEDIVGHDGEFCSSNIYFCAFY
jgi:hypothetical protein